MPPRGRPRLGDKKRNQFVRVGLTLQEMQRLRVFLEDKSMTPKQWFYKMGMAGVP